MTQQAMTDASQANAVLFLGSDEARYVTGVTFLVDAELS